MQQHNQYLHIPKLLNANQINVIKSLLATSTFVDGKATASQAAQGVKDNLQIDGNNNPNQPMLNSIVLNAIYGNPLIQAALLPKMIYPPLFSKYEVGMTYGWHVDSPIMGNPPVRTDLGCTIFLNEPDTYEGGELVVQSPAGEVSFKLSAGDAILYPAMRLHKVAEVTKGERLAVVTWVHSGVRSPEKREILYNLKSVHQSLVAKDIHSAEANLLLQMYSNLLRMWVEI